MCSTRWRQYRRFAMSQWAPASPHTTSRSSMRYRRVAQVSGSPSNLNQTECSENYRLHLMWFARSCNSSQGIPLTAMKKTKKKRNNKIEIKDKKHAQCGQTIAESEWAKARTKLSYRITSKVGKEKKKKEKKNMEKHCVWTCLVSCRKTVCVYQL